MERDLAFDVGEDGEGVLAAKDAEDLDEGVERRKRQWELQIANNLSIYRYFKNKTRNTRRKDGTEQLDEYKR